MTVKKTELDELLKCISELDMDEKIKASILDCIRAGQTAKGIKLLRQYRSEILDESHTVQNKLYQIDFVLQKVK